MLNFIKQLFNFKKEELPPATDFYSLDSPELAQLPSQWKLPWQVASAKALRLSKLSRAALSEMPRESTFQLPQEMQGFEGVIEVFAMLTADITIRIIVKSNELIGNKEAISAEFEVTENGTTILQPWPMWSGPNNESLAWWKYGHDPK